MTNCTGNPEEINTSADAATSANAPPELVAERRNPRKLIVAPENDLIYKRVDPASQEFAAFRERIRVEGVLVPLAISLDNFIVSGHRRRAAAIAVGLEEVPVFVLPVRYLKLSRDERLRWLRKFNDQRHKSPEELVREALVDCDPEICHQQLLERQAEKRLRDMSGSGEEISDVSRRSRCKISNRKSEMLDAVAQVVEENVKYWPLSVRQVHYRLLNLAPRLDTSKKLRYKNTQKCYKTLVDLMVRARLEGFVEWKAVDDETRRISIPRLHPNPQSFVAQEVDWFLQGYRRDLLASQPDQFELVVEKLTVCGIVEPLARAYGMPLTVLRGFSALVPLKKMADRFKASGKSRLLVLVAADLDPDGCGIGESVLRALRDDFHIPQEQIQIRRVAITPEHVAKFQLPPDMEAKTTSSRYRRFAEKYPELKNASGGYAAYELEALSAEALESIVKTSIRNAIDGEIFNKELEQEKQDAAMLSAVKKAIVKTMGETLGLPAESPETA